MIYIASVAMSASEIVASKVRQARIGAGMTQAELGEKLGTTWHTVSRWERSKKFPEPEELDALSEQFGCPLAWFFLGDDEQVVNKASREIDPHEALRVIARIVDQAATVESRPPAFAAEPRDSDPQPVDRAGVRVSKDLLDRTKRQREKAKSKTKPDKKTG